MGWVYELSDAAPARRGPVRWLRGLAQLRRDHRAQLRQGAGRERRDAGREPLRRAGAHLQVAREGDALAHRGVQRQEAFPQEQPALQDEEDGLRATTLGSISADEATLSWT